MANMARKITAGEYQIGIYNVRWDLALHLQEGKGWRVYAIGPGTIGDGFIDGFQTLDAAHLQLTGEPRRQPKARRSVSSRSATL